MSDFMHHSSWPIYCDACDDMTSANLVSDPLRCGSCGSEKITKYDRTHLVRGGKVEIDSWGKDTISDGNYLCPRCKQYSLRFGGDNIAIFD